MSIDNRDKEAIRCRMLGHEVNFAYCRQVTNQLPCRKILDCWFERFDVAQFVRENYSAEEIAKILAPPKPRITSIVELIQQAKENSDAEEAE